jgi:hypothetical protein
LVCLPLFNLSSSPASIPEPSFLITLFLCLALVARLLAVTIMPAAALWLLLDGTREVGPFVAITPRRRLDLLLRAVALLLLVRASSSADAKTLLLSPPIDLLRVV